MLSLRFFRGEFASFVLLTLLLSWTIWAGTWWVTGRPATTTASSPMLLAIYLGSFAPVTAAAIILALSGTGELKAWLWSFVRIRCGWRTYAAALLPLPILLLCMTLLLGYSPRMNETQGLPAIAFYLTIFPLSVLNGLATSIIGAGPLGEEGGWRGYFLPQLLKRHSELKSSIIVGVVWSIWHLPIMAMFSDWRNEVPFLVYLPIYTAGVIGLSVTMTRIWRMGNGSLIPCIWLHGLVNQLGATAFNRDLWVSPWTSTTSTAHFGIALCFTALLTWYLSKKWVT